MILLELQIPPSLPIVIGTSPRGEGEIRLFPLGGNKKGGELIKRVSLFS
jgi:hypothetical protein